jgi:hypothetical protein
MANRKQSNDFAETAVLPTHLRPDRLEALEDAAALREQHAGDVAVQYAEYAELIGGVTTTEPAPERAASPKIARKRSAQKKRAKRAKRSARSKH